ncbi:hypothetical protein UXN78_23765, partial [Enterobacter hormaechei]
SIICTIVTFVVLSLCCTLNAGRFSGGDTMSKATNTAATKRNNRKIHARKFLATPEGKAWLAKKQEEREEIKLARAANNMF